MSPVVSKQFGNVEVISSQPGPIPMDNISHVITHVEFYDLTIDSDTEDEIEDGSDTEDEIEDGSDTEDESQHDVESEGYLSEDDTYTGYIQNMMLNHNFERGTPEYDNLVYQSGICRLVDSIDYQLERYRNSRQVRISKEEANIHLDNLDACACCDEHRLQREARNVYHVDSCLCMCSELYEEVCGFINSSNNEPIIVG